jgi:hypothetical protein
VKSYLSIQSVISAMLLVALFPLFPPVFSMDHQEAFHRRYPRVSHLDTPRKKQRTQPKFSKCFRDDEIIEILADTAGRGTQSAHTVHFRLSPAISGVRLNQLHILQQSASKGCGPAVYTMRALDLGNPESGQRMQHISQLTNSDDLKRYFENEGLTVKIDQVKNGKVATSEAEGQDILDYLSERIPVEGPVITSITDHEIDGHWIIVDEVTENDLKIRDPFHGWMIRVTRESFFERIADEPQTLVWVSRPAAQAP